MVYWVKLNLPFLFFVTYLLVICPCLPQTNFGTHVAKHTFFYCKTGGIYKESVGIFDSLRLYTRCASSEEAAFGG